MEREALSIAADAVCGDGRSALKEELERMGKKGIFAVPPTGYKYHNSGKGH
jgi:hypothetical protein